MPISITITAEDAQELQGWARLLLGMAPGEIGGVVELTSAAATVLQKAVDDGKDEPTTRRTRRTKEQIAADEAAAKRGTTAERAAQPEAEGKSVSDEKPKDGEVLPPEGKAITVDDVRGEMKRISADHGLEATRKLLAKVGIARLGDLEPAKYPEFMGLAKTWTGAEA